MGREEARYIWCDEQGLGRNVHACFRRTFELKQRPENARINIFADTVYQLFVNGRFVEFGPVRFDPRFPLHDPVDIAKHLQTGPNCLAILVKGFGQKTFKAIATRAGLLCWGDIPRGDGSSVPLESKPENWRCAPSRAHTRHYAPKLSFALDSGEIYDQAQEPSGWTTADFDDATWPHAVEMADQDNWGPTQPRNIPFMSGEETPLPETTDIAPLADDQTLFSFQLPAPFFYADDKRGHSKYMAVKTHVHSPRDQLVNVGVFWCDNWINGEKAPPTIDSAAKNMRGNQIWRLRKGWNLVFSSTGIYQDALNFYFAFSKDSGVTLSAAKDLAKPGGFLHHRPLSVEEEKRLIRPRTEPFTEDDQLSDVGGWILAQEEANSPYRECGLDTYLEPTERLTADQLADGHVFRHQIYPNGFSLLLDFKIMRLFFPKIRAQGVEGAKIDIQYSEKLRPDNQHIDQNHVWCGADRVICARDTIDWTPVQPRGARYCRVTFRDTQNDVKLENIAFRSALYPAEIKGAFQCSDPLLENIWKICADTLTCNMEDAYVDCSGRERGMYGRDVIIQYHVNLATVGDHALMRRCMELYGQSPDQSGKFRAVYPNTGDYTISDFALNMVEGFWNYYHHSGDQQLVRQHWDAIIRNLQWFHQLSDERDDLLLDADWNLKRNIDAMYGGFHGDNTAPKDYFLRNGVNCVFTGFYVCAMLAAIKLARAIGEHPDVLGLETRVAQIRKNISNKFWNPKRGRFADDLEFNAHSAHASLMAVRCGAATHAQINDLKPKIRDDMRRFLINGYDPSEGALFGPSYSFYVFETLYQLQMPDLAEELMRKGWGWFLSQGCRSCPEFFNLNASLCHAWSAAPAWFLSSNVLGVQFPEPANPDKINIQVQTNSIQWAKGKYPHPRGLIEIQWRRQNGQIVFDKLKAPKGVEIQVAEQSET